MNTAELIERHGPRESTGYDAVIVGAGPSGLATAIRFKPRARDASAALVGNGSKPGAHILSVSVTDPRALGERLPDWLVPRSLHNGGCGMAPLGDVVRWLADDRPDLRWWVPLPPEPLQRQAPIRRRPCLRRSVPGSVRGAAAPEYAHPAVRAHEGGERIGYGPTMAGYEVRNA